MVEKPPPDEMRPVVLAEQTDSLMSLSPPCKSEEEEEERKRVRLNRYGSCRREKEAMRVPVIVRVRVRTSVAPTDNT